MRSTRHLALPVYSVGALLVFLPLIDFVLSVFPIRVHEAQWRFGAEGLLSRALLTPILGLLIWFLLASFLEQRGVLRLIAGFCSLIDVILAVVIVSFSLDALQVRGQYPADAKVAFIFTAVMALVKHTSFFLASLAMGMASWRLAHRPRPTSERDRVTTPLLSHDIAGAKKTSRVSS